MSADDTVKWYEAGTARIGITTDTSEDGKYLHLTLYITSKYPWEIDIHHANREDDLIDKYECQLPNSLNETKIANLIVSIIDSLGYSLVDNYSIPQNEPKFPMDIKRVPTGYTSICPNVFTVNSWEEYRSRSNSSSVNTKPHWDHRLKTWYLDQKQDYTDFVVNCN